MKPAHNLLIKFFVVAIFAAFSVFNPKIVCAEWTKYAGNPIISGTPGSWDSRDLQEPNVIKENGIYKMWYTGNNGSGWRIGYATSLNGFSWTGTPGPIIQSGSTDGWEMDNSDPFVIHNDDGYIMWYSSLGYNWAWGSDRFRLRYATSNDGISWTKYPTWILIGTPGSWDNGGINRGISIMKTNSSYKMWYTGVNEGTSGTNFERWQIGYATSPDGVTWTKNSSPVVQPTEEWELYSVSYPNVIFDGTTYEMWYTAGNKDSLPVQVVYATSTDGINWDKPAGKNPVFSIGPPGSFDSSALSSPFILKDNNLLRMFYGGLASSWNIGYAEEPIPTSLQPLVLLPGLGASWNHENMVLGIEKPQLEWYMSPTNTIYDGLIQTLKNAGYQTDGPNRNLFIFNYNWTKSVDSIVEDLKNYIENIVSPPPGTTIDLVGHSLGGLVARTYVQNNPDNPVDQIVSLGSPHKGVAHVYYVWEGGDFAKTLIGWPPWIRAVFGMIIYLRRPTFATNADTVHHIAPVIKDLLPTFDYLKLNGIDIPIADMSEKNNWLINLNNNIPNYLLPIFTRIAATLPDPDNTVSKIEVEKRNWLDKILKIWPDGRPTGNEEFGDGDDTVLTESAKLVNDANVVEISGIDHTDLIATEIGQSKLMEVLNLSPSSISTISEEQSPGDWLVFQIASPATISINGPDGNPVGMGNDKLIVVKNAPAGEYQVILQGTGEGKYSLYVGQITNNGDFWSTIAGGINTGQLLIHKINFQPSSPLENPLIDPTGENQTRSVVTKLEALKEFIGQQNISLFAKKKIFLSLGLTIRFFNNKDYESTIYSLYGLRVELNALGKARKIDENFQRISKNKTQEIIDDLEELYVLKQSDRPDYNPKKLASELMIAEKSFEKMEKRLKKLRITKPDYGTLYLIAQEKLDKAKSSSSYRAHINAVEAKNLSQEGLLWF